MCSIGNIHFDFNCASSAPGAFSNEQQQKSCPNIQLPQGSKMSPGSDENESAHTGTYVRRTVLFVVRLSSSSSSSSCDQPSSINERVTNHSAVDGCHQSVLFFRLCSVSCVFIGRVPALAVR